MSITIHISFKVTRNLTTQKNNNQKYNKDNIGGLGLLKTEGKTGIIPFLSNKDRVTSMRKTISIMEYRQTEIS